MLHFEVVSGNSLPSGDAEAAREVWRTIKPYSLPDLDALLKRRLELRCLPGKRRAQLRRLFDDLPGSMRQVQEPIPADYHVGAGYGLGTEIDSALQPLPVHPRAAERVPGNQPPWGTGLPLETRLTDLKEPLTLTLLSDAVLTDD
jgi:hypothetical protein